MFLVTQRTSVGSLIQINRQNYFSNPASEALAVMVGRLALEWNVLGSKDVTFEMQQINSKLVSARGDTSTPPLPASY